MSFSDPGGMGIEGAGHHLQIDRRQGCREPGGPRRLFSAYCARICTQVLQAGWQVVYSVRTQFPFRLPQA